MAKQTVSKTISEFRTHPKELLQQVKTTGPLYITYRSKQKGVLLSVEDYNKLQEMAENYDELQTVQEYEKQDKSKIKWLTHEELLRELA
ncbi:MAG TPA: type II toxin-antitoxin system prevent-host-death family antitoxin [Candidatus Woesebacteria bacterium]|nr:type II toxin-antitoxin system prevent-host-death family antitoxin [Candidatus Woesebacteria bacterium]